MKRVFLLFLAGALFVACNRDELPSPNTTVYFADKIVETVLPSDGTQTQTTEQHYEYANLQFGLVNKHTTVQSTASGSKTTTIEETFYDDLFPKQMTVTVDGAKQKTVSFDSYDSRGRLTKKTTLNAGSENLPIVEEYRYEYDRGFALKEHTKQEKKATGEIEYTIASYSYQENTVEVKTSVYTETNNTKTAATVVATDKYTLGRIFQIEVVREHSYTAANGQTSITKFEYDLKTNPNYLLYSYRIIQPELFLNKNYTRYNIVKETISIPNAGIKDYEEETSYTYYKEEYPLTATVKQDNKTVKTKHFTY